MGPFLVGDIFLFCLLACLSRASFFAVVFCVAASAAFCFCRSVLFPCAALWFGLASVGLSSCVACVFSDVPRIFRVVLPSSRAGFGFGGRGLVVLPFIELGLMAGDDDTLPPPGSGGPEEVSGHDGVIIPGRGPNITSGVIQTDSNVDSPPGASTQGSPARAGLERAGCSTMGPEASRAQGLSGQVGLGMAGAVAAAGFG